MDTNLLNNVTARVVSWHNRHPLARRVAPADVDSIGVVALPFMALGSKASLLAPENPVPSLKERTRLPFTPLQAALNRLKGGDPLPKLRRIFSENFIEKLSPQHVGRWILAHGFTERPGPPSLPERHVLTDAGLQSKVQTPAAAPVTLYLLTAAINFDQGHSRLLLGQGAKAAVLGKRRWSHVRIALAIAMVIAAITAFLALQVHYATSGLAETEPTEEAEVEANPASEQSTDAGPDFEPDLTPLPTPTAKSINPEPIPERIPHEALVITGAIDLALPSSVRQAAIREGRLLRATSPSPATSLTESVRSRAAAAASAARAQQQADAASVPATSTTPLPATVKEPVYALVTAPTRSKADSEIYLAHLRGAAANVEPPVGSHTEVVGELQSWRAVWWPFLTRQDAERVRNHLAARGLKVELVEF